MELEQTLLVLALIMELPSHKLNEQLAHKVVVNFHSTLVKHLMQFVSAWLEHKLNSNS
jgi:hypothetical protein